MFYRACRIINMALSLLFILVSIYTLFTLDDASVEGIMVSLLLLFFNCAFLLFDFICGKILFNNNEQKLISKNLILSGKILFVINLVCALGVFLCIAAAISSFSDTASKTMQRQKPFYIFFLLLFLFTAITAIFNLIFFSKSLKKNKVVLNELISNIGS
jgi:hypothetical protein